MRAGVAQAINHASHRSTFGKVLVEQPLMQNVLADLAVESEAATISAMRLARSYDEAIAGDDEAQAFKRIANAVLKYWICKRGAEPRGRVPRVPRRQRLRRGVGDAAPLPRGAAGLDLGGLGQRAVPRRPAGDGQEPRLGRGLLRRGRRGRGASRGWMPTSPSSARSSATWRGSRRGPGGSSSAWRSPLQGSLLVRFGDEAVADAFCASRLAGDWGHAFGTLPAGTDFTRIIDRHRAAA